MKTLEFFGPEGRLAKALPGYEDRQQQVEMAEAVSRIIRDGGQLMVEAGTGVGKSLAYLIPAFYALHKGKAERVVISTATKNLQDQLIQKDIPLVQSLFDKRLKVVNAVGRGNFVSLRRLQVALRGKKKRNLFNQEDEILSKVNAWAMKTSTGLLDEARLEKKSLNLIRDQIESDVHHCMFQNCPRYDDCFYQRMKKEMTEAGVIVINHAYLLSLLAKQHEFKKEVMPHFDVLIVDEAHRLEDMATETLGLRLVNISTLRFFDRLFSPEHQRGLLAGHVDKETLTLLKKTRKAAQAFFENLHQWAKRAKSTKNNNRNDDDRPLRIYRTPGVDTTDFVSFLGSLEGHIKDIASGITAEDHRSEVELAARKCRNFAIALEEWMTPSSDTVHWLTASKDKKGQVTVELRAAPLAVGDTLNSLIYENTRSVILTSATLTVGNTGDFSFMQERLGLEQCETLCLGSPFDYSTQAELHLYRSLPDPRNEDRETYMREAVKKIKDLINRTDGHAFVLFTSIADMELCASLLDDWLKENKHPVYKQHGDLDRSEMLTRFMNTPRSVLFGVASFWDGVDVPGKALSNVIIFKLPFDVPTEPLFEARREAYERKYGNNQGFYGFALPRAVLRLRQAFGRLIRTKTDTGIVAVLDPRILSEKYGETFLNALPKCPRFIDGKRQA
ncbi:MAG: DEAD/DEAH box helicase [Gemmatales bacterium]|nr:DEAD/DEAH box helicase [Gemmatales bacterium]MDW8386380.1 helicase C-terminal domain-containing protein [Gemmatales bacterium]